MRQIVTANEGYLFNEESKKLEKYEFIKAEFCLNSETPIRYYCKLAGVDTVIETLDLDVYVDGEGFKRGCPCQHCSPVPSYMFHRVLPHGSNHKTWVFEDGEAKLISALDISLTYENGTLRITSGKKYHGCKADVFKYNDYVVKEADGSERLVKSPATLMALSAEQKDLVAQFEALHAKMEESGLRFLYSTESGDVVVYKEPEKGLIRLGYEDWSEDGYILVDDLTVRTKAQIAYYGTDDGLWILPE